MNAQRLFLIGFSFTGKTQTGQRVAERLGWKYVDTDDLIVRKAGKSIPRIFAEDREDHFRKLESQVLASVCRRPNLVVATGGGMILRESNRQLMTSKGVVVCLEASPETIHRRLLQDAREGTNPVVRPLLQVEDPLEHIRNLKEFRQPFYSVAHWTVHTDNLTLDEVADEIVRGFHYASRGGHPAAAIQGSRSEAEAPYCHGRHTGLIVRAASASYPVCVRPLSELGRQLQTLGFKGNAFLVSDDNVFAQHGAGVEESLRHAGFRVCSFSIPPGEESKSVAMLSALYDWLLAQSPERGHCIVALGGGVVGDLAGLAAATMLRGIPYVQVPTSLLAMVDSSVGGKTAVNHPAGKNLIGAFYQPSLVLIDPAVLRTLPPRELTSGWAEIIKHAMIRDAAYFRFLGDHRDDLLARDEAAVTEAILWSVRIKAEIVGRDERETTGERSLLNYGHTLAHGLETAAGYGRLLHGEAVAIGMTAAGLISRDMGLFAPVNVVAQTELLRKFGLPTTFSGADRSRVAAAMSLDKKIQAGKARWVLLEDIGRATMRNDVPPEIVARALDSILS